MGETRVVALTGGIGSGKSSVARSFEKLGALVIDADAIVHELQAPGQPLLDEIAAEFGRELIDGSGALDREALGAIVFRDPDARLRLNRLVHPKVGAEMARRLQEARDASTPLVLMDIPLYFESRQGSTGGASAMDFQAVVLVWVPRELQIERTVARDTCPPEEVERRIAAQLPIDEKRELADFVIDNSGSLEATEQQVAEVYRRLVGGARRR